jgi:hypothetical protein
VPGLSVTRTGWRLQVEDARESLVEALTDLLPSSDSMTDTLFMIVAAKEVMKPPAFFLQEPLVPQLAGTLQAGEHTKVQYLLMAIHSLSSNNTI